MNEPPSPPAGVKVYWKNLVLSVVALIAILAIGIGLREPDLEPDVALVPTTLPGFRVSLPAWERFAETADYWNGIVKEQRGAKQQIRVTWFPGADTPSAHGADVEKLFGQTAMGQGLASLGQDTRSVGSRPASTHYFGLDRMHMAVSMWSCATGRQLSLTTFAPAALAEVQRLHWRIADTVACTSDAAPAITYPVLVPPTGFSVAERTTSGVVYTSDKESLLLSSPPMAKQLEGLQVDPRTLAPLLGASPDGALETLPAEKYAKVWRLPVRVDDEKGWLTVAVLPCGAQRFVLSHTCPRDLGPALGLQRFASVSCPK